jgi:hypothetical protein
MRFARQHVRARKFQGREDHLLSSAISSDFWAVFDEPPRSVNPQPRFHIIIRLLNKRTERFGVEWLPGFHFDVPHALARSFQQVRWIFQLRTEEETHAHVRPEYIDVSERNVAHTYYGAAIMHQLQHVQAAGPHPPEPCTRDIAKLIGLLTQPSLDSGITLHSQGQSEQGVHEVNLVGAR